ncbi:flagellar protein FlhE [Cupriavidus sp. IDO]|uniref:flagellar protein FlhE n=1 Tax=Cupriavidus sp. IDO TaxID=1539142 RepID=UPI0005791C76|nr:flagellar protein FlhE [Cupriavidus sp. IDO]KWR87796.1 flagellar biosynthesis protein FlhE [Cupriavidus sp. IDO]
MLRGAVLCGACTCLAALTACAWASADTGTRHAWTASVNGPALYGRGQRAVSPPILPSGNLPQAEGVITSVRWRYSFAKTPPVDLQAYLCNAQRCVLLPQAEGLTEAFGGDDATQGFVFAFRLPGQGAVAPALQGKSNQVTVGFR